MEVIVNSSQAMAVALVRPAADKLFNWGSGQWEPGPFVGAAHARPLAAMEAAPSPMAAVQSAAIGYELLARDDAAAVLMSVSGSGAAAEYVAVDVWAMSAAPLHASGGFVRQ